MGLYVWPACADEVRSQLDSYLGGVRAILGPQLLGAYLHGSLAMGCPVPVPKDMDLLFVIRGELPADAQRGMAELVLARSGRSSALEVHVLREADLRPWQHPTPFAWHYSEDWRPWFEQQLVRASGPDWSRGVRFDGDLAAHLTIARSRGITLWGPPAAELFPPVPREDYLDAILSDFAAAADQIVAAPVYGVLNLCRVCWYLRDGAICSKEEAGAWGILHMPAVHQPVIAQALALYRGMSVADRFDAGALRLFAAHCCADVRARVPRPS